MVAMGNPQLKLLLYFSSGDFTVETEVSDTDYGKMWLQWHDWKLFPFEDLSYARCLQN